MGLNGHEYAVTDKQRERVLARVMAGLNDLLKIGIETGEHPTKKQQVRIVATCGGFIAERTESKFKLETFTDGGDELLAAHMAIAVAHALSAKALADAATLYKPYARHLETCAGVVARAADGEGHESACTCGLDKLLAAEKPSVVLHG